jgi:carbonic anhydrase-like protein
MERPVFESTHTWEEQRIRALAIYCSDGRWGEAFDEFCHEGLSIPRYDRFAVPGGPAWLTLRDVSLMRPYDAARQHLEFLVRAHQVERVILISHYGCAFYGHLLGLDPDACLPAQREDLETAATTIRGWFAGIQVETYLAMRDGTRLSFHGVGR